MNEWLVTWFFVLCRVGSLTLVLPLFSMMGLPRWTAGIIAIAVATLITLSHPASAVPTAPDALVMGVAGEITFGLSLGLGVAAAFAAFSLGAEIMSVQMAYSFAVLLDPLTRSTETVLGTFASWIAGLAFVALGLHGRMLEIVAASFAAVPAGTAGLPSATPVLAIAAVGQCIALGVQLAGPVLAMVWLVQVFVAMLSKLAPKMHAFFAVGLTATSIVGLFVLVVSLPWLVVVHAGAVEASVEQAARLVAGR